ncbi:LacI family DNA-binding transcriptional regulator [Enterococcus faecium]|uniref:LacI family DNA-binding transcriptional regulator n=1 Tax=Enterococcus faecium TaxID=1352 RepID=UPI00338F1AD6
MNKVKLEDVAKHANVSPTTVSRVINNRGSLSDKTKAKVFQSMEELGYYPNEIARSLFGKKTHSIGILFPDLINPFFGEMVTKLENLLADLDYKVLICNTNNDFDKETKYLKMLLANQVDGIIVGSHNKPNKIYQQTNLPIVAIDRFVSESVPIIRSDNYQGACLATNYLIQKGCRKIALISGSTEEEVNNGEQRAKGYFDTLRENDLPETCFLVEFDKSIDYQKERIQQFLIDYPDIDGVFVTGDAIAALLLHTAQQFNRNLEIVGYDGTQFVLNYFNQFPTVRQPTDEMASKTIDVLFQFINGNYENAGKEFLFKTTLVE